MTFVCTVYMQEYSCTCIHVYIVHVGLSFDTVYSCRIRLEQMTEASTIKFGEKARGIGTHEDCTQCP